MRFKTIHSFFASVLLLLLAGCGGGSAGQNTPGGTGGTFILATVSTSPSMGSVGYDAMVEVKDGSFQGTPIADAVVVVNGKTLTYDLMGNVYRGSVTPDASMKYNLTVTAKGKTFTSVQDAPSSITVMNVPGVLTAASPNTISWLPNISANGMTPTSYEAQVFLRSNALSVYTKTVTGNSVTVPANTLKAGTEYCVSVASQYPVHAISNADADSQFIVAAIPLSICEVAQ